VVGVSYNLASTREPSDKIGSPDQGDQPGGSSWLEIAGLNILRDILRCHLRAISSLLDLLSSFRPVLSNARYSFIDYALHKYCNILSGNREKLSKKKPDGL
jgi:hypothetical protein